MQNIFKEHSQRDKNPNKDISGDMHSLHQEPNNFFYLDSYVIGNGHYLKDLEVNNTYVNAIININELDNVI